MMNSNDIVHQEEVENLCKAGKWAKVLKMYEEERDLRTAKITATGDTILHMAVHSKKEHVVESLVDIVCGGEKMNEQDKKQSASVSSVDENGDEKSVLRVQNEKGDTPLHLAASIGNAEICKKISGVDPSLIAIPNGNGETPLFMAGLDGNRKAFLWLHYRYMESPGVSSTDFDHSILRRNNDDTILHCALEEGHIDVAIEIVHLYEDHLKEMIKPNKNELSPLHLLAGTPSAFESNDLLDRSSVVQLLYRCPFRVKRKKHATTKEELEQREREPRLEALIKRLIVRIDRFVDYHETSTWAGIRIAIGILLLLLVVILLFPPAFVEMLLHKIRNLKEKHTWSVQIVEKLLLHAAPEDMSANPYEKDSGPGSKIVDTPLMIAAKNGVIEMVQKILEFFPSAIKVVNEEKKNIVLLAAEKRQTKLYRILRGNEKLDKSVFSRVDKDGNTALHLAARLGVHLNWQTTTMVEEFKWFEFVKRSVPSDLWEIYNKEGKTAEEIFRESYKEYMTSDRDWLNQTSQACSVASTLVASMAYSYIVAENFDEKNYPAIVALSLSLTSTISFLGILAFRSQSLKFWKYVPFMLQIAILTMFGTIVALWISLMLLGKSLTTYAILGSPIAILTIVSLPIFIGPTLMSLFTKVPPPDRSTTSAIRYRRPQKKENETDPNSQN
ncbi:uncharacterized protein LOC114712996 [Neltuma alba]|uniref:uncharacterized protein LOC114712996 n=1 Tax=Neltuma alba TaxID=207710 RepID=UPI0010A34784|nr:uncharacterized protein LOC114712996 [Prosopis alba]